MLKMLPQPNGDEKPLPITNGIDILGNIIEASALSVNQQYYGSLHNNLHVFTSLAHDPDGRFRETMGVMSSTATAMRDPVFYRVHGLVDEVYNKYKETLPPYTPDEVSRETFFKLISYICHINFTIIAIKDTQI